TLIRQATIADRREALAAAEKTLRDILADPAQARWKEPAERLLGLVRAKLYPQERMAELSAALSKPGLGKAIAQAMVDFTTLWDHENKGPVEQSDLADWITAFQQGNTARAIEQWRRGESPAWLVAALASVKPGDPAAADLVEAGRKVGPEHPAYATVAYHGIALQIARGERDPAREWADRALAAKLPVSVQNAIRGQRMTLAHDWTDYLRHASRMPVAVTAVEVDERLEDYSEAAPARPIFDRDFTEALNQHVPLALWVDGGASPLLPRELQLRIAQAGWVRAALLGRTGEARALGRRVAELDPELAEAMRDYAARQGADDAKFTAVFWILRTPGLGPEVRDGLGRLTETRKIDNYRDNWWRLPKPKDSKTATPPAPSAPIPPDVPEHPVDPPAFLAQDQRTAGDKEWLELRAAAHTAPNYLCAQTLVWAAAHPDDPRVPEALHLSVRATRYSLPDAATSDYSRKAFQLLHARYPQTRWAQQTKYWY
ncbi:MAG TPA: hypothetical protein VG672_09095, partial [Bryobacteraceae bacterium]|nr:hypothetical protein [Bryobacteraceae bacterium]